MKVEGRAAIKRVNDVILIGEVTRIEYELDYLRRLACSCRGNKKKLPLEVGHFLVQWEGFMEEHGLPSLKKEGAEAPSP